MLLLRRGRFEARRGLELIAGALVKKLHVLRIETKPEMAKLPVLVFCNVECAITRWDIIVFEVQEHDDICILLYLPGFSQALPAPGCLPQRDQVRMLLNNPALQRHRKRTAAGTRLIK